MRIRIWHLFILAVLSLIFPLLLRVQADDEAERALTRGLRRDYTRRLNRLVRSRPSHFKQAEHVDARTADLDQEMIPYRQEDPSDQENQLHDQEMRLQLGTGRLADDALGMHSQREPREHDQVDQASPQNEAQRGPTDDEQETKQHSPRKRRRPKRAALPEMSDAELDSLLESEATIPPTPLPPPRFMVVALHSNIQVFPRIMRQIQPQVNKEWMVSFVIAQNPKAIEKSDWDALFDLEAYITLASTVHSIKFSQLNTTNENRNIANDFSFQHEWWKSTPESIEHFWIVQDDAAVCSNNSKYCIYDFLDWDYLGAPLERVWWRGYWGSFGNEQPWTVPSYGNGGFSIRSRRLQLGCTAPAYLKEHKRGDIPEDVYFSMCLRDSSMKFRVAPDDVAKQFSSERPLHIGSFGWHLQSSIRTCNDDMIRYCPEALDSYKRWGCGVPKDVKPLTQPQEVKCHFNKTNIV